MSNYYDDTIEGLIADIEKGMEVCNVIKFYENLFRSGNEESKRKFSSMSFLSGCKYEEAEEWVEKALADFRTNEVFLPLIVGGGIYNEAEVQVFCVKTYRKMLQKKRKAKLEPVVTTDELVDEMYIILGDNK